MSVNPAIAIWMFLIWLLSINSFCNVNGDKSCIESLGTLDEVLRCPNNEREWIRRAKIKNCTSIKQTCSDSHQFQYHCVLNEYGTRTIEVCAPVWYLLGFCASFKESKKRIGNLYDMKCSEFEVPCPDRFLSNESFKYQDCYTFPKNIKSPPTNEYSTKSSAEETLKLALSLGIGIPVFVAVVGVIIWRACINKRRIIVTTPNKPLEMRELLDHHNNSSVNAEVNQDTESEAQSGIDYEQLAKSLWKTKPEFLKKAATLSKRAGTLPYIGRNKTKKARFAQSCNPSPKKPLNLDSEKTNPQSEAPREGKTPPAYRSFKLLGSTHSIRIDLDELSKHILAQGKIVTQQSSLKSSNEKIKKAKVQSMDDSQAVPSEHSLRSTSSSKLQQDISPAEETTVETPPLQPGGTKDASNSDAQNVSQIPEDIGQPSKSMIEVQDSLLLEAVRKTLGEMSESEYNNLFARIKINLIEEKSGKAVAYPSADEPNIHDASETFSENLNLDTEDLFGSEILGQESST